MALDIPLCTGLDVECKPRLRKVTAAQAGILTMMGRRELAGVPVFFFKLHRTVRKVLRRNGLIRVDPVAVEISEWGRTFPAHPVELTSSGRYWFNCFHEQRKDKYEYDPRDDG